MKPTHKNNNDMSIETKINFETVDLSCHEILLQLGIIKTTDGITYDTYAPTVHINNLVKAMRLYAEQLQSEQKQSVNGMKNIPAKIYLQTGLDAEEHKEKNFNNLENVCWCTNKQFETDIEYVLPQKQLSNEEIDALAEKEYPIENGLTDAYEPERLAFIKGYKAATS